MYLYCRLLVFSSQVCCVPSGSAGECAGLHATSLPRGQAFYQQLLCGYSQHFKSSIQTQHHRQLWVSGAKHWLCGTFIRQTNTVPHASRCLRESRINPGASIFRLSREDNVVQFSFGAFQFIDAADAQVCFLCFILFSLLIYLWRQNCTVRCDAFIQCVIYCRSHSIVSSLFLEVPLVQCRSLVFTATPLKG